MKPRQIFAAILSAALLAGGLAACGNPGGNDSAGESGSPSSDAAQPPPGSAAITLYNPAAKHDSALREMTQAFTAETGIAVQVLSPAPGADAGALLGEAMAGDAPPAILLLEDPAQLGEWEAALLNLAAVEDPDFRKIHDAVPDALRLSPDAETSYGVPQGVEGLGYLVDPDLLDDFFGAGSHEALLRDLRACSYREFTDFCDAVSLYRIAPAPTQVELCGNTYVFHSVLTGRARNLNGVFALPDTGDGRFGGLLDTALAAVYPHALAAARGDAEEAEVLRGPLRAYAQAVDHLTTHMGGLASTAPREELVTGVGHDLSLRLLAEGNALFLPGATTAARDLAALDGDVAARVEIIPAKLPLTDDMIRTGKTAAELDSALAVRATGHYAVNAAAPPEQRQAAIELLVWIHRSANLQRHAVNAMGLIPWYHTGELGYADTLGGCVTAYLEEDRILAAPSPGAPDMWAGTFAVHLAENYFTAPDWTEADHTAIADHAVTSWQSLVWTARGTIE